MYRCTDICFTAQLFFSQMNLEITPHDGHTCFSRLYFSIYFPSVINITQSQVELHAPGSGEVNEKRFFNRMSRQTAEKTTTAMHMHIRRPETQEDSRCFLHARPDVTKNIPKRTFQSEVRVSCSTFLNQPPFTWADAKRKKTWRGSRERSQHQNLGHVSRSQFQICGAADGGWATPAHNHAARHTHEETANSILQVHYLHQMVVSPEKFNKKQDVRCKMLRIFKAWFEDQSYSAVNCERAVHRHGTILLIVRECSGFNPWRIRHCGSWCGGQRTSRQWERK